MNKTSLFLALMLSIITSIPAFGYDFESGGLYFEKTGDNAVAVTSGKDGYSGDIIIPASVCYDGVDYAVTAIGNDAFAFCGGLTSIVISDGVERIGDNAFVSCTELATVTLPGSLRVIGDDAFYGTSSLHQVILPEGLEHISKGVFHYSGLTEILVPSTVSEIDAGFISGSPQLSATHPAVVVSSVRVAEGNLWYGNMGEGDGIIEKATGRLVQATEKAVISEGVTTIGSYSFFSCNGMEEICLPESITSISDYAFMTCTGLKKLTCHNDNPPTITVFSFGGTANGGWSIRRGCTLFVPKGCVDAYVANGWTGFMDVKEIDSEYENPNAIENIDIAKEINSAVYDLQGRRLQSNEVTKSQGNGLPKGIYIIGGKKVVIK